MIRVSGWSRVPEPPARMTPFTRAMLYGRYGVDGQNEQESTVRAPVSATISRIGPGQCTDAGVRIRVGLQGNG